MCFYSVLGFLVGRKFETMVNAEPAQGREGNGTFCSADLIKPVQSGLFATHMRFALQSLRWLVL